MISNTNFKKIYIRILIFLILLTIIAKIVNDYSKKRLQTAIDKGNFIYSSQTTIMMAQEGNLKWFENKDYLHEKYDYQDRLKNSYIHEAIRFKRYEVISYLIKTNKKFNIKDKEGYSPISLAAKMCDFKMVELLAAVNKRDSYDGFGKTADMYLNDCEKK